MDIQELANTYAKEQLDCISREAIEKIYIDGFKAGYLARSKEIDEKKAVEASLKSLDDIDIVKPLVKDLLLPSHTLWTDWISKKDSDFKLQLSFREAQKYFGQKLPRYEDWQELNKECQLSASDECFSFLSADGKTYYIRSEYFYIADKIHFGVAFWLQGEESPEKTANCVVMYYDEKEKQLYSSIESIFVGESLPVILAYQLI